MASGEQTTTTAKPASCPKCSGARLIKRGKDRDGHQLWGCKDCGHRSAIRPHRPLSPMRIPLDKAIIALNLLVEGSSVRAVERIVNIHRDTVCRLVRLVGDRCADFLAAAVQGVEVADVELDEVWGFVGAKQGTLNRRGIDDPTRGDAWTYLAVERNSKMILTHLTAHSRDSLATYDFVGQVEAATAGHFQISCDGLPAYPDPIIEQLGTRVDACQLIKEYGEATKEERRKYSPARIISSEKRVFHGRPDMKRVCTSIVERTNLSVRTFTRRMTRLTCAFSKKWENHAAALSLFVCHFNFARIHSSIRCTPAMAAGVTPKLWTMADLVAAI